MRSFGRIVMMTMTMKSVMRNYCRNEIAQYALSNIAKQAAIIPSIKIQAKKLFALE